MIEDRGRRIAIRGAPHAQSPATPLNGKPGSERRKRPRRRITRNSIRANKMARPGHTAVFKHRPIRLRFSGPRKSAGRDPTASTYEPKSSHAGAVGERPGDRRAVRCRCRSTSPDMEIILLGPFPCSRYDPPFVPRRQLTSGSRSHPTCCPVLRGRSDRSSALRAVRAGGWTYRWYRRPCRSEASNRGAHRAGADLPTGTGGRSPARQPGSRGTRRRRRTPTVAYSPLCFIR